MEIEHLRSRLDQSEADLERLRSVNERTEERLRGELHEARAESRDVSSKRSQELNEAVEALQLRLAQAEAAKQTAIAELEKSRGDAQSELDKEQLKAEAELKIALADSEALRTKLGEVGPSREELNEARARAKDFRERYMNERKLRRKLTDELAELKGNIRVVARCRPPNDDGSSVVEFPSGADGALEVVNDHGLTQRFEFDRVFRPGSQSDIFDHVAPVIQEVVLMGSTRASSPMARRGAGRRTRWRGRHRIEVCTFARFRVISRQARRCRAMREIEHAGNI